jgi:NAD(P)-dependent dehydrogenase (short-subunit alcohol dehydrogenase family)
MRTALITGAGSGIGRCFAETLGARGVEVLLIDLDEPALAATRDSILRAGGRCRTARADVADRPALTGAVDSMLSDAPGLDLLVNCAAVLGAGIWTSQPAPSFEQTILVDLLGTANAMRAALPALRRARGTAVILASTAALHGWPHLSAYAAAKFGLVGFADSIRPELRADGVRVTTVFPLLIDTPLLDRPGIPPILRRGRRIPAQRVVDKVLLAVDRGRRRVYIPESVRFVAALHGLAPGLLDWWGARFGLR